MKQEDRESLLGDYGVRKYDADIGRFLSVDKLFQQQPGYSPYHYSANDPVNASDGSGLFMQTAMVRSSLLLDAGYDPTGDGGGGGGAYGTESVKDADGFTKLLVGGTLGGQVFGPAGNMQVFVTGTITVYGSRTRIEQQIDGWIGSGREYMGSTRTSTAGNGSMGGYNGPIGGGWSISSYEKPSGSYVRDIPILGGLLDAGWVAAQSLTRVSNPTHIDGTLVEGQERMESFVVVSSTILTVVASRLLIAARGISKIGFKELQTLVKADSKALDTFFKSKGTILPSKEALLNYKELATRMLNGTGGAYQKVTEAAAKLHTERIEMINNALKSLK